MLSLLRGSFNQFLPKESEVPSENFEHSIKILTTFLPRRNIGPLGFEASNLVDQNDIKVNGQGHLKIYVVTSSNISFVYKGIENFFIYVVGLHKTFKNITLQPLHLNNYIIIAPIVQSACYRSLIVIGGDLKLSTMSSVHLEAPSIYSYREGPRPPSNWYCPLKFQTFNKNTSNF